MDEEYRPFSEEDIPFDGIDTAPLEETFSTHSPEETTPPQASPRKSSQFSSLKDVLRERGNFWEEKQQKTVNNIWQRDTELPEDEIIITNDMVV